ncbi:MAG: 30S ribosomal protein S17e [Nanoarchaeota archaeon]
MGRIKTQLIKRVTFQIYDKHNEKLTKDFYENKNIIKDLTIIPSKKILNVVCGYLTRLMKERKAI